MNMQVHCNDLYNLNETNTELFNEHKKWYKDFKANSVGDLIDKQQDMIDSYKKAVDNSTMEINDLKDELQSARDVGKDSIAEIRDLQSLLRQVNNLIAYSKEEIDALRLENTNLKAVINKEATTENMIGQL